MPKNNKPTKKDKTKKEDRPFRSFRRTYKNDYLDTFEAPKIFHHIAHSFGMIFKNWKLFGGLLLVTVIFGTIFVGLLDQKTIDTLRASADTTMAEYYQNRPSEFIKAGLVLASTVATGGISRSMSGDQWAILLFLFVSLWLTTIYFLRQILAGRKVTLRKGLYNAFGPLVSTFLVFLTLLVELLPLFLVVIFYSAAVETDFLSTPFYALIFLIFALLLIVLSCYLVSSTIIALAAVSAPGTYPKDALMATRDLMAHRRSAFIIRIFFLVLVVFFNLLIVMIPMILLDGAIKSSFEWTAGIPFVSFWLFAVTCFNFIYIATYIYLYYKELLKHES